MAFNRGAILAIMISVTALSGGSCYGGAVYKVGDSAGWGSGEFFDYKTWASTKTFKVGDTIVFEYDKQKQNVIELRHLEFHFCNTTSPMAIYSTGNDSIALKFPGHYYYTSGFVGHCKAGLKVDFRVLSTTQTPIAASPPYPHFQWPPILISPSPPNQPSPHVPTLQSPSPPSPTVKNQPSPTAPSPPSPSAPTPSVSWSPPDPPPKPKVSAPQKSVSSSTICSSVGSLGLFALGLWVAYLSH